MDTTTITKILEFQEVMHRDLIFFCFLSIAVLVFTIYLIIKSKENTQE